jgi:hypothetical protein
MVRLESPCGRKKRVGLSKFPKSLTMSGMKIKIGWAMASRASRLVDSSFF